MKLAAALVSLLGMTPAQAAPSGGAEAPESSPGYARYDRSAHPRSAPPDRSYRGHPEGILTSVLSILAPRQLSFHPAPDPNGVGILVLPGGGYGFVSMEWEGESTVSYLNERGYDAWVLDYTTSQNHTAPIFPIPQEEALAAVGAIHAQGRVDKLGIWGFSAGGHLAAMTVTNPRASLDFGILAYPVITMDPDFANKDSRANLIGDDASPELQRDTSAENAVTRSTPPIFIFHTADDDTVPIQNALRFTDALVANGRPFQSLILPHGKHGIALGQEEPALAWTNELERWMEYSI